MNYATVSAHSNWIPSNVPSLESSDEFVTLDEARNCPEALLSAFVTLMAVQGRRVDRSLLAVDREYAMWQLAMAHTTADDELRALAVKLFGWFDDADHAAITAH